MASHHLSFMEDRACLSSSHHSFSFCCGNNALQDYKSMKNGQYAETDGQYVFCQTNEEAKINHERYHQGLLTYKDIPVAKSTKHIELVYKDKTTQTFKSHLGDVGYLDYQAMAAALADEEKKTTDQMVSQVLGRNLEPAINYDKLAAMLAVEERKTTDQIVSHVLAYIQQPAIDYGKLTSFLAAEEKKSTNQIISQAIGILQQPTIDYDELVIAFDPNMDGANIDAGPGLISAILMLVLMLTVFGCLIMAIKRAGAKPKRCTDALNKLLKRCGTSTDENDAGLTEEGANCGSSKETSSEESEDNDDHEDSDESDDSEDNDESEVITTATITIKSVPTFSEYVHEKAKSRPSSMPKPTMTSGATVSLGKAKVITDALSGFKDPAERKLVEDMLLDATYDIMNFGEQISQQYRKSLPAPDSRKRGLDFVDQICKKGKQYTDKAKRDAGVAGLDKSTPGLEKQYQETLDKGYNTGAAAVPVDSMVHDKKGVDAKTAVSDGSKISAEGADGKKQVDTEAAVERTGWKAEVAQLIRSTGLDIVIPSSITGARPASFKANPRHPSVT